VSGGGLAVRRDERECALVRRVALGDEAAFSQLVQVHEKALAAYARRMLGEQDAAADVVQETLLRLWCKAASFDGNTARLGTWLHNIAHNLCIDRFRKQASTTYLPFLEERAFTGPGPEACRQAEEVARGLRRAIDQLPERQRSALLLCHDQGLSNREAAATLAITVEALESLLVRARKRLGALLRDAGGDAGRGMYLDA
jgi:RNA polymerase sigma-70 factor (ECF subfamily)